MSIVDKFTNLAQGMERAAIYQAFAYDDPRLSNIRKESIRRNPNLLRRYGSQVLRLLPIGPALRQVVLRPYKNDGYEYIGAGSNAITLRMGQEVTKILRLAPIPGERRPVKPADAPLIANLITRLSEQHPEESIATNILLKPKHYYPGGAGLMLRQPYVDGQALEDIPDITESIRKQVVSFAERSLDAAPQTGVSPDVVGVRNLIFSPSQTGEPSLKIVDSIPLILNGHTAPNMALLREMTKIKVGKNAFPRMQADAWRLPDAG